VRAFARTPDAECYLAQLEIPAALQSAAKLPAQSCEAGTNLSAMTVEFMLALVTHSGLSRTEGTAVLEVVSSVVPLTRLDGGVWWSRAKIASAAAAWASS